MSRKIVLNAHEKTPLSAGLIPVDSRRFCVIILVMKTVSPGFNWQNWTSWQLRSLNYRVYVCAG